MTGLAAGSYDVQTTWNTDSNHATMLYSVLVNGTLVGTYTVNQQVAPTGTSYGGVAFQTLVTSVTVPAGGTLELELSGMADGYVIADAWPRFAPSATTTTSTTRPRAR